MESMLLVLLGGGSLVLGGRMLAQASKPAGQRKAIGGVVLMLIGLAILIGSLWSAGTLVGSGG